MRVEYRPLGPETVSDVVCCPGGLELRGKKLRGNLDQVIEWRRRMLDLGMRGVVAYTDEGARGFAEYMPVDTAPVPITASGAAVLTCYHWAGTKAEDPEHLAQERELIEQVIKETRGRFSGLATQGWNAPTHFPISFLKELGFHEITRHKHIALLWLPYQQGVDEPTLASAVYAPQDLSSEGLLAIDVAFSTRCPYSIHSEAFLTAVVSEHPLRDRIRLTIHRIDTREDAFTYAVLPLDWNWIYLNGREISLFGLSSEKLAEEMTRKINALG